MPVCVSVSAEPGFHPRAHNRLEKRKLRAVNNRPNVTAAAVPLGAGWWHRLIAWVSSAREER